ncbi:hypothetical protein PQU92_04380 [Asticcacaulis sp. BYS171W]|uniref:Uncharacterized protein n=1 Tax=Asticcacaulis aquaticus TaxID=2984212 RepID=A0ABT5HR23_9CAUL|nr:hypothetical protein [Asticcacaulis aquaticus]MDC7682499.1 hypothetical protein [Asticcacaulis aquaticus]
MQKVLCIAAGLALMTTTAHAGSFRVYDLNADQNCECDCFTGLHRLDARTDADGHKPLLYYTTGNYAEIRIDGVPVALKSRAGTQAMLSDDGQTRVTTRLKETDVDGDGLTVVHLSGTLTVTHRGMRKTVHVKGFDVC